MGVVAVVLLIIAGMVPLVMGGGEVVLVVRIVLVLKVHLRH